MWPRGRTTGHQIPQHYCTCLQSRVRYGIFIFLFGAFIYLFLGVVFQQNSRYIHATLTLSSGVVFFLFFSFLTWNRDHEKEIETHQQKNDNSASLRHMITCRCMICQEVKNGCLLIVWKISQVSEICDK